MCRPRRRWSRRTPAPRSAPRPDRPEFQLCDRPVSLPRTDTYKHQRLLRRCALPCISRLLLGESARRLPPWLHCRSCVDDAQPAPDTAPSISTQGPSSSRPEKRRSSPWIGSDRDSPGIRWHPLPGFMRHQLSESEPCGDRWKSPTPLTSYSLRPRRAGASKVGASALSLWPQLMRCRRLHDWVSA